MLSFKQFLFEQLKDEAAQDLTLASTKRNYLLHTDTSDDHAHLSELHKISDKNHYNAVRAYTMPEENGLSSKSINEPLINKTEMDGESSIHHNEIMDMHKSNAPLEREIHTYSNMGQFDVSKHVGANKLFHSPAHLSTSLSPAKAREHNTDRSSHRDSPHVLHLKLPKGYSGGRYIAPYSKFPEEQEMLLKPDQKFKITGKTELGNCTVHHAEPVDHINEEKSEIPYVFATIHTKSKDRPKGLTGKQITKMNEKANKPK